MFWLGMFAGLLIIPTMFIVGRILLWSFSKGEGWACRQCGNSVNYDNPNDLRSYTSYNIVVKLVYLKHRLTAPKCRKLNKAWIEEANRNSERNSRKN